MSTNFVNLGLHPVQLYNELGEVVLDLPPSGTVARVQEEYIKTDEIDGVPVYLPGYGEVENLPPSDGRTKYVVSLLVAQQVPNRDDVFYPGQWKRDGQGRIVGAVGLLRWSPQDAQLGYCASCGQECESGVNALPARRGLHVCAWCELAQAPDLPDYRRSVLEALTSKEPRKGKYVRASRELARHLDLPEYALVGRITKVVGDQLAEVKFKNGTRYHASRDEVEVL
jgi:hypothetical protein